MAGAEYPYELQPNLSPGSRLVETGENGWRLEIPAGDEKQYRLAQLDDYGSRPRADFPWKAPPLHMSLRARVSAQQIPGTWGFGLWNDPFSMAVLSGAERLRLPVLPNTAWFFFASPPNYLSLRDDLPAQGFLAATFRSPRWPAPLLALGAPALPLLLFPPAARLARRIGRRIVRQNSAALQVDPTRWHEYSLQWLADRVRFAVDGREVLEAEHSPQGPLGFVLWIDNQYAAFTPQGRLRFGTVPSPQPAWLEVTGLKLERG
ncbi:MAG: hypothetical protein GX495_05580 [Chloroflexi bacterium]|nr:hypothetical protein [Chloroflexota bacterium]